MDDESRIDGCEIPMVTAVPPDTFLVRRRLNLCLGRARIIMKTLCIEARENGAYKCSCISPPAVIRRQSLESPPAPGFRLVFGVVPSKLSSTSPTSPKQLTWKHRHCLPPTPQIHHSDELAPT